MTKQETKLEDIEKKLNAKSKIKDWIRADRDGDGPITIDGKPVSQAEIDELAEQGTGLIVIHRVDAPLPKEEQND